MQGDNDRPEPARTPAVSVIIVTWKVRELLRANLTRLFSLDHGVSFEVLVVDNNSEDGTVRMIRREFPRVRLVTNDWDAGFAGPNNQALRLAKGQTCILLNPDMLVEPKALKTVHDLLTEDQTVGVAGIRLIGHDGRPIGSVRRFPDFASQLCILLKIGRLFPKLLDRYMFRDFDYYRSQDVDQVRGSFFAFRRELLDRIGYLDEGYHLWFEEVDFCLRAQKAGLRIRFSADAEAHDHVGQGFALMGHAEKQAIFTASMVRYFRKHGRPWQAPVLAALRPFAVAAAAGADLFEKLTGKRI
ncbi:glycosyltransferase family 2 protein [Candidatus Uhrbacteria bacterium]|nr:glycosyltransferase family 2 protein [Candidatus Uhrbacteria bacterium]